ncbi:MAG: NAD(P)/FAD-dependent oxidoreductase [Hymenobacter sp.]
MPVTADTDTDAIVIGAGHNGLVAANLLADAGWRVVVLEATPHPGGAIRTAEVTAPGFHSDLYSAFYPLGFASPVLTGLRLEQHGLRWLRSPSVLSHVLPDGRTATLYTDINRTAASVDSFAAGDGAAWREMYDEWLRISPALIDALFRPFPPVRPALGLLRALGSSAELIRFLRFVMLPVRRLGEERFGGEGARMLLAGNSLAYRPGTGERDQCGVRLAAGDARPAGRLPRSGGGAERLVDALVARLVARGGEVRCSARVQSVVVRDGRAWGVRTADGETLSARRAVLADVPAPVLYQRLVASDAPATEVAQGSGELPVGQRHDQSGLGAVRAGAVG